MEALLYTHPPTQANSHTVKQRGSEIRRIFSVSRRLYTRQLPRSVSVEATRGILATCFYPCEILVSVLAREISLLSLLANILIAKNCSHSNDLTGSLTRMLLHYSTSVSLFFEKFGCDSYLIMFQPESAANIYAYTKLVFSEHNT